MQRKYAIGFLFVSSVLAWNGARPVCGQESEPTAPGSVVLTTPGVTVPPGTVVPGTVPPGSVAPVAGAAATTPPVVNGAPAAAGAAVAPKPVMRSDRPAPAANADELKVQPNELGLVKFNFQGQPWLEVLEWLAKISHLSLDWQELPGDHLNLATQRGYTVAEARDLINRHLLDRGYTLLRNGEVLTVVNIKKLDPSLVPRVRPADLAKRDSHEFVKVSFALDWLLAEHAVEELKPMLSPNGKLTALKSTNRLEAMDAVTNLQEIYEVLVEEQSRDGKEQLVQEFPLKHTRAADVDRMLRALMGMQKNQDADGGGGGSPAPDQFMAIQQQLQQMQQQQQQQQQQPGQPGAAGGPKKEIHIVVNSKRNSLLVQAPADKMAVIAQAVQHLDVGSEQAGSLMHAINSTKVYRLSEIDPASLAKMMEEMGNLDPKTRIKVDAKHHSIIVTGALADHMVISELIKKLDGTDRRFEVVRLRRLQADYVAGTIEFMMGVGKKDEGDNMNPFMAYRFGMDFGGGGADKKGGSKFKVSADTENNRLLLWTNEIEMKEVQNLLIKLGETPSKEGSPDRVRVIEAGDSRAAKRLAEQLLKTRPEFKIEIQEEATPEMPAAEPAVPQLEESTPSAKRGSTKTKQPQAQRALPARKAAPAETRSKSAITPRRPGESGRILQAGRAVSGVTLARLQLPSAPATHADREPRVPSERAVRKTAAQAQPARQLPEQQHQKPQQPDVQRAPGPVFNPNRALQPTFAAETETAAESDADVPGRDSPSEQLEAAPIPNRGSQSGAPRRGKTARRGFASSAELDQAESIETEANPQEPRQDGLSGIPEGVQVIVTANGQLIIASTNTQALDELEDMISQIAPPRRDFKIFHLKNRNTWPTGVVWNLEKYFGTEKEKGGGMKYSPYWGMYPSDKKEEGPNSLSKRRIPKFIADSDSHTILVTGADPEQLRVIQELIDIYDKPDVSDNKALRLTKIFQLKHSKARIVADAVKEVYRDLLSANDPALQAANQGKDQKPVAAERQYTYIYGGAEGDKDKNKEPEAPIKFKGLLSMGVDELSNTVIVSAQEGLLENIGEMINSLDVAARPTQSTIQVIHVDRHVEASGLHERLSKILTRPQVQHPHPGQPNQNPNQPQPGQPNAAGQPAASAEGGQ
jgi:type II secretory pathway component GspD/PulD (secretin)